MKPHNALSGSKISSIKNINLNNNLKNNFGVFHHLQIGSLCRHTVAVEN